MENPASKAFQDRIGRIETLIQGIDEITDEQVRTRARELVAALLEMQGAGLERIMEIVYDPAPLGNRPSMNSAVTSWFRVCCFSTDCIRSISRRVCDAPSKR